MKALYGLIFGLLTILQTGEAWAQITPEPFVIGSTGSLRSITAASGAYYQAAAYQQANDNGGGLFVADSTAGACQYYSTGSSSWTAGNSVVTVTSANASWVGKTIYGAGSSGIPNNDTIVSVNTTAPSITLAVPPYTSGSSAGLNVTLDNGGTIIGDNGSGTSRTCFRRVTSTYNQIEWGAINSVGSDSTAALQNWLSANQPHVAVPGQYYVSSPLYCNSASATFAGPPPAGNTEVNDVPPLFQIVANDSFYTGYNGFQHPVPPLTNSAVLEMMAAGCAIHDVAIFADPNNKADGTFDVVDIYAEGAGIFHSYLSGAAGPTSPSGGGYGAVVNCIAGSPSAEDVEIYDNFVTQPYADAIDSNCANFRVHRNVVSGQDARPSAATGVGIRLSKVSEATVTDNTIEQAAGIGLWLDSSRQVRVEGNYFDNNGKYVAQNSFNSRMANAAALAITNSTYVTTTGNIFHRSDNENEQNSGVPPTTPYAAHVYLGGQNDSLSFGNNVYYTDNDANQALIRPDFVFDADPATTITNGVFLDRPGPANIAVCSPNAAPVLGRACASDVPQKYLSGLTMTWVSATSVSIAAGQAVDHNNSTMINVAGCTIDGTVTGAGGVDVSGGLVSNTTYYVFVISGPGGANPSCIVSQSLTPSFKHVSTYNLTVQGTVIAGSPIVFNVGQSSPGTNLSNYPSPLGSLIPNSLVTDTLNYFATGTTIASIQSAQGTATAGSVSGYDVNSVNSISLAGGGSVVAGMSVTGTGIESQTNPNYVAQVDTGGCTLGPHCFVMAQSGSGTASSSTVEMGGQYTLTLSNSASGVSAPLDTFHISAGTFRLIGAINTNASGFVPFTQDGDTFYLATSTRDIGYGVPPGTCQSGQIGTSAVLCPLLSVPTGIQVEAFGRVVGGSSNEIFVTSPGQSAQAPTAFSSGPPGFTTNGTAGPTSFPFRAWTDTSQNIRLQASSAGTQIYEVTDGWVFHRSQ